MKEEILKAEQLEGTPAENVKQYVVKGNNVHAEFWNASDALKYMKKYTKIDNGIGCIHTTVAFANFQLVPGSKIIEGHSTYHSTATLVRMFEDGLSLK